MTEKLAEKLQQARQAHEGPIRAEYVAMIRLVVDGEDEVDFAGLAELAGKLGFSDADVARHVAKLRQRKQYEAACEKGDAADKELRAVREEQGQLESQRKDWLAKWGERWTPLKSRAENLQQASLNAITARSGLADLDQELARDGFT